jgi:hypothetical protein
MLEESKYYDNVFVIKDEAQKKKYQEEFILSLENDMKNWEKNSSYKDIVFRIVDGTWKRLDKTDPNYKPQPNDEIRREVNTDYYSPDYNGFKFQYDLDKNIGILWDIQNTSFQLVFDYKDYWWSTYPKKLKKLLKKLTETVFTAKINNLIKAIPQTPAKSGAEEAEEKREEREEKLKRIFKDGK